MDDSHDTPDARINDPERQRWSREELLFLGGAVGLLVLWALISAVFGYGGFILVALAMVAAVYGALVLISRG